MARTKKQEEELIEVAEDSDTELELEANEIADEEELSEVEEEEEASKKTKTSRSRRRRKEPVGTAAQLLSASSQSDANLEPEEKGTEIAEAAAASALELTPPTPQEAVPSGPRPRRPRATSEEKALSGVMESAMDSMVKHWSQVRDISTELAEQLTRVTKLVQELPPKYESALQEIFKQPAPKPTLLAKVTVGASAASLIFSLVSLTLSHSIRTQALGPSTPSGFSAPARVTRSQAPPAEGVSAIAVAQAGEARAPVTPAPLLSARAKKPKRR